MSTYFHNYIFDDLLFCFCAIINLIKWTEKSWLFASYNFYGPVNLRVISLFNNLQSCIYSRRTVCFYMRVYTSFACF
jgi:hypothetical protein